MTQAEYLSWFDEVVQPTESLFRRVPSDKLGFQITPRSFTIGQQLRHIPASFAYMAKVVNQEELPYKSVREILVANRRHPSATVDEAVEGLKHASDVFKQAIGRLSEDQFQNGIIDTPQKGSIPYWRYGAFALEHHIHHLMELHLCLRILSIDVNTKTLYEG